MSITGERDGAPVKLGTSAFDIVAGLNCHAAVLAALLQRKQTGRGQKIETSLLEGEVAFLANAALEYQLTGNVPGKWGSEHPQLVPYKVFKANDGWLVVAAGYQNQFAAFLGAIEREDLLSDPRYASESERVLNRDALYLELDAEIARHPVESLLERLEAAKVPARRSTIWNRYSPTARSGTGRWCARSSIRATASCPRWARRRSSRHSTSRRGGRLRPCWASTPARC